MSSSAALGYSSGVTIVEQSIRSALSELLLEEGITPGEIGPDSVLLDVGLDSLGLAVLVTRLETNLGYDPFSLLTEAVYPRTLSEFVAVYENNAPQA